LAFGLGPTCWENSQGSPDLLAGFARVWVPGGEVKGWKEKKGREGREGGEKGDGRKEEGDTPLLQTDRRHCCHHSKFSSSLICHCYRHVECKK